MNLSPGIHSALSPGLPAIVPSWSILGSTNGLRDPFGFLLKNYQKYGPVFRIRVLGETSYVLAGKEACQFFADSDPGLWNRSKLFGKVLQTMGLQSLVVASDGERYRRLREATRIAFSRQAALPFIGSFIRRAAECGERFGSGAPVMPVLQQLAFDQLREFTCNDTSTLHFSDCSKATNMMLFSFLNSSLRSLFLIPGYSGAAVRTFKRVRQIVAERQSEPRNHSRQDMLDLLRTHAGTDLLPLNNDELTGALYFGWASGLGYSSRVHSFLLYRLLKNSEVYEQVQSEVDRVFHSANPSPADLRSMTVFRASILETLRLYPIQTVQPYQLNDTIRFQGFEIPEGSKVYFYPSSTHYDPEIFIEPEKFDPHRFLSPRNEHKQKFAFNAFGVRPRNCAASGFVETLALCTIGSLMFNNRLELTDPDYTLRIKATPVGGPCKRFRITATPLIGKRTTIPIQKMLDSLADRSLITENDLDQHQVELLRLACDSMTLRKFNPGETIICQGDPSDKFFMILDGAVEVLQISGDISRSLKTLHRGDYFGEIGLIEDCPRTASVVCGDSVVELGVLTKDVFLELVKSCNLIGEEISSLLQERLLSSRLSQALPGIKPEQVERVLGANTILHLAAGEVVFHQGDEPDLVYIIVQGCVDVLNVHPNGQSIHIASLGPGQFFGEAGILNNQPRNSTVRVGNEAGVELIAIQKAEFVKITMNLELGRSIHAQMAARLRSLLEAKDRASE